MGPITVLQATAIAEGFKETARLTEVILIRRRPDGRPFVLPLNLKAAISGVDVGQDLALLPHDVVHVPRSTLASANLFVDQAIREMIPVTFGFRLDTIFWNDTKSSTDGNGTTPPDEISRGAPVYGSIVEWIRPSPAALRQVAGPNEELT